MQSHCQTCLERENSLVDNSYTIARNAAAGSLQDVDFRLYANLKASGPYAQGVRDGYDAKDPQPMQPSPQTLPGDADQLWYDAGYERGQFLLSQVGSPATPDQAKPESKTGLWVALGIAAAAVAGTAAYFVMGDKKNPTHKGPRSGPWGAQPWHRGETWIEAERDGRRRALVRFPDGSLRIVDAAGVADTFSSVPARVKIKGKTFSGYISIANDELVFNVYDRDHERLMSALGK